MATKTLKIEYEGLRAELDLSAEAAWAVLRYAHDSCTPLTSNSVHESVDEHATAPGGGANDPCTVREVIDVHESEGGSAAARMREITRRVLADGDVHERREICAAVREAGLKAGNLDGALKGLFERGENVLGRPTYRDPNVDPPERNPRRPEWLERIEEPKAEVEWDGSGIEVVGKLGTNGSGPDG